MSTNVEKLRIISLQKQLRIARLALDLIGNGCAASAEDVANDALEEIAALDPSTGLQGLVGHGENVR